ncbi:11-beta-hydroxysteroid dehydrogenase 1A-like [Miscanthus floridulus]|uniref:11-beta-hydroxysteroid dehydrogenase 1A-like n=1 Tax=Miscanthus floridulus TaxID=154761 RepID=UPI003457BE4F
MVMSSRRLAGAALQVALTALLPLVLPAYYVYKVTTYLLGAVFPEDVAGKVVLITGASSGIGEHLAYEYAKRGAYLALVARREASLREVGDVALGLGSPGVLVLLADVSKPQDCETFINDTIRYFGRLDHLVNNASIRQVCKFEEIEDVKHFRALMDINFWGHVYPTRLAIPHLKRSHGRIVGVTSNSSYIFIGRDTFYNASKAAALSFYDTLRMELGGDIRITEVVPGVVESEITKGKMLTKEGEMKVDQDERDTILGPTPAEPVGDFARTVVRDVCRGARYVFEPRWYMGVYLLRACLPEVLVWNSRLLTVDRVGASITDTLGKCLLDLPGVRRFAQPPSLRSPEIKDR